MSAAVLISLAAFGVDAQPVKRIAIISANGSMAQANPVIKLGEDRITESLNAKLAGYPGITLIAQKDIQPILDIQDGQNTPRSSLETAAKIGKVTNAEYIVLVSLVNASQTSHQQNSATSIKTIAVVEAEVTARLENIESGVNIATPRSTFKDSAVATETKLFPIMRPPSGNGLPDTLNDLWTKATDSLTTELASKLKDALNQVGPGQASTSPSPTAAPPPPTAAPKVIGIDSGSVFIDSGSKNGIKIGDRFQIVRIVATSLIIRGTPVTRTQRICILTVDDVSEETASGKCTGDVPQKDDVAHPVQSPASLQEGASASDQSMTADKAIPSQLLECEDSGPCNGAWTIHGSEGEATWFMRSPIHANLTVVRWVPDDILIKRTDITDANSAVYAGSIRGDRISGTVVWSSPGHPGESSGKWSAFVPQTVCNAQANLGVGDALQIGRNALMFHLERNALACYIVAAKNRDSMAETAVGLIYYQGQAGVQQDYSQAFFWLLKAADQGIYAAQETVSDMYRLGRGTPRDEMMAKFYGDKAAEQKHDFERQQDRQDRATANMLTGFVMGSVFGALF